MINAHMSLHTSDEIIQVISTADDSCVEYSFRSRPVVTVLYSICGNKPALVHHSERLQPNK